MENETLATELLHELKATSKRWFIAFLVVLTLWFATIIGFVWYITLPVEETSIEMDADEGMANLFENSSMQGDITNGKD